MTGRHALQFLLSFFLLCACLSPCATAQTSIPIGTWRYHLSFNHVIALAQGENSIYAAAEMGVLIFDKGDNSLTVLHKLNGLSGAGISSLAYSDQHQTLVVGYSDGNLDLITAEGTVNFTTLQSTPGITVSRKINHILVRGNLAYLSTNYGVVVFNLVSHEVKETWRDLGRLGASLAINKSVAFGDSIALATAKGLLLGHTADNLMDFSKWRRMDSGALSGEVGSVAFFNDSIFVTANQEIFSYRNNNLRLQSQFPVSTYRSMEPAASSLVITGPTYVTVLNTLGEVTLVSDGLITEPQAAILDSQGAMWVADSKNGLVSDRSGTLESYLPNGPTASAPTRLRFVTGKIFALRGGFSSVGDPLQMPGQYDTFENGIWSSETLPANDLTDVVAFNNALLFSSFGKGIVQKNSSGITVIDASNSPLEDIDQTGSSTFVTSMHVSSEGLWVANYGASSPLHRLDNQQSWQSFSPVSLFARYPMKIVQTATGHVWLLVQPTFGGGVVVYDPDDNSASWKNDVGGGGGLPSTVGRSMTVDREDNVWVGTLLGLGYFYDPDEDLIKPIFENRFLLKDEDITAITVDGGNRKWIGTTRGAWLFDDTGESLIHRFSSADSPLLSDVIHDITIDDNSGEVFFATARGICSFRADATREESDNPVRIFPNPVYANFNGSVGIAGLPMDAIVKITDVNGKLVNQTHANGTTATWNVRDFEGRRARTGIYLVFSATADGRAREVGKIVVIE